MHFRKRLRTVWYKVISSVFRGKNDTAISESSPAIQPPRPTLSDLAPTSNSPPQVETTLCSEEWIHIPKQSSVSQSSTSSAQNNEAVGNPLAVGHSSFFGGSHHLVFDRAVLGENQQIRLHYHGSSSATSGRLRVPSQENSRLSRKSSDQGEFPVEDDGGSLPGNSTFIAHNQNIHLLNNDKKRRQKVLRELRSYTIAGTEFNSAERDPPPKCHPGTRTSIREELRTRIEDGDPSTRIIWIHGPAGVGKSAIMQSVVEEVVSRVVCATLFFSRPNRRHNAKKTFTTLAYPLAVANRQYCHYIETRMEDDPGCLSKSLDHQFKTLFITPFVENHVQTGSQRWIMFLDGLDECENTKDSDNQYRVMKLISDSIFHYADRTPFIWVIASRPEDNLKKAWLRIQEQFRARYSDIWELNIPVNSDQAARDVELFLHKEFEAIREKYSDLISGHSRWPSDGDFVKIAEKSSGLFIFASTVIKYISHEDPVSRLGFVISLINQAERHPTIANERPFHMIDLLYSSIMSDVPMRLLPVAKSLLGFYLLSGMIVGRFSASISQTLGFICVCNILGLRQNDAYAALRKLQSVLEYPLPIAGEVDGVRFFHASFSDFLLDRSRSQEFYVDLDQELTNIWRCFIRMIKQSITEGHAGISVSWPLTDGPALSKLKKSLLWQAEYNWIRILINNSFSRCATRRLQVDTTELIEIFQRLGLAILAGDHFPIHKFLVWLEKPAPNVIQEKIVPRGFPLNQLDIELLFKSLCATPWYRRAMYSSVQKVDLTGYFKDLHWAQAKAILWAPSGEFRDLVQAFDDKSIHVTVIGLEPSESCAIIAPIRGSDSDEGIFYILPYSIT